MRIILGGTFDPIHHGHLRMALEVGQRLGVSPVWLLPAGEPPHRGTPQVTAADRLEMVRLAAASEMALAVDDREVRRGGRSYMVDTLAGLRAEIGPVMPLTLVMGQDAFSGFDRWHHWMEIVQLAHIIVLRRPGQWPEMPEVLQQFLETRLVTEASVLFETPAGAILPLELSRLDISSTRIRADLAHGRSPRYLIPDPVLAYIRSRGLYQPVRAADDAP